MLKAFALGLIIALASETRASAGLASDVSKSLHDYVVSPVSFAYEDQFNVARQGALSYAIPINSIVTGAQVVTTGFAGKLSRVELGVLELPKNTLSAPLSIDIARMADSGPDLTPEGRLATHVLLSRSISTAPTQPLPWDFNVAVDFSSADLYFGAQERFAILLRSTALAGEGYIWAIDAYPTSDTYLGGAAYYLYGYYGGQQQLNDSPDTQFRTFMLIPEPSALMLAASSLLGLTRSSRGRRSSALMAAWKAKKLPPPS